MSTRDAFRLLPICFCCLFAALVTSTSAIETWIGSAPFCRAKPSDCHQFDLTYIRSDTVGVGRTCRSGTKVNCQSKPLDHSLTETPKNDLVVVAYNVWERPFSTSHDGQTERTCHLPRALLNNIPDVDVMVLNEIFIGGCMQSIQGSTQVTLTSLLDGYGFSHYTSIVGEASRSFYNSNGGAVIVSKWPITQFKEMVYTDYAGVDVFKTRGAVYAKVSKQGVPYHIVGTQLQSGDDESDTRVKQATQLARFITELELPLTEPVIVAGDFNSDRIGRKGQTDAMLSAMQVTLPTIVGDVVATFDYSSNELIDSNTSVKEWLDYVVFSTQHKKPDKATLESYHLRTDTGMRFCTSAALQPYYVPPNSNLCYKAFSTHELSIHFPVIGRFTFN